MKVCIITPACTSIETIGDIYPINVDLIPPHIPSTGKNHRDNNRH